jgi:hypothetical protein
VKSLRTIQFDASDAFVFERAAAPGVTGLPILCEEAVS